MDTLSIAAVFALCAITGRIALLGGASVVTSLSGDTILIGWAAWIFAAVLLSDQRTTLTATVDTGDTLWTITRALTRLWTGPFEAAIVRTSAVDRATILLTTVCRLGASLACTIQTGLSL